MLPGIEIFQESVTRPNKISPVHCGAECHCAWCQAFETAARNANRARRRSPTQPRSASWTAWRGKLLAASARI